MFKKFVKPKLKTIGKAFTTRTHSRYYRYLYYNTCEVVLTKNYCLLKFTRYRYRAEFEYRDYGEYVNDISFSGMRVDTYLIGFNSDNKLFVNKLGYRAIDYRSGDIEGYDTWHSYGVIVVRAKDSLIHNMLGYNHDCGDLEKIVVNDNGVYRVQGEVLLNALKVSYASISDAVGIDSPVGVVHDAIYDYLMRFVANEIMYALVNLGFNVEYARRLNDRGFTHHHAVIIPNALRRDIDASDARFYIELIIKSLQKNVKEYKIVYNRDNDSFILYNDLITALVIVRIINTENDNQYDSIVFSPARIDIDNSKIYKMLFNELREAMKGVKRQDYTIALGNHLINIRNAIALNIEYTPNIKPKIPMLSDWSIRFNLSSYYVDNISLVEIEHSEHGKVTIEFNGQYLIRFDTNNLGLEHRNEWNRAVLYSLIEV
jgi:hypothetical protein